MCIMLHTIDDCVVDAFSPTLIEVRHAFTGRLAQLIPGTQSESLLIHSYQHFVNDGRTPSIVALTFDGSTTDSSLLDTRVPSTGGNSDRSIHVTMRVGSYFVLYEVSQCRCLSLLIGLTIARPVDDTHMSTDRIFQLQTFTRCDIP